MNDGKKNYTDAVESEYVEPGYDVYNPERDGPLEPPQSDAEPVRWEFRTRLTAGRAGKWILWLGDGKPDYDPKFYQIRPLYAGEPQ
jgi:hypothetical protein